MFDAGQPTAWSTHHRINDALTLEAAPGHTPGASMVRLSSDGEEVLFIGDTLHSPAQVHDVHTSSCFDEDPAMANATRERIFTEAAEKGLLLFPAHFGGHGGFKVSRNLSQSASQSGPSFTVTEWAPLVAM